MTRLLKNARIPEENSQEMILTDILIEDGFIRQVGKDLKGDIEEDLGGALVLPGLIDVHVHMREPGYEHKETISSASRACARGGYTHVIAMPNTNPVIDSDHSLEMFQGIVEKDAIISVSPAVAITKGISECGCVDFDSLLRLGAAGFSNDGNPVFNKEDMIKALDFSKRSGAILMLHEEDKTQFVTGAVNRGKISMKLGVDGIPNSSESDMLRRDIDLLRTHGGKIHICHVSTKESVELIRNAKKEGLGITCEAAPHHFSLTEDTVLEKGTLAKVNPPLRKSEDALEIVRGLIDGTIDMIATDHAPHTDEEKKLQMSIAPYGISGIETGFSVSNTFLVESGHISLAKLSMLMSTNPARIFGFENEGAIWPGKLANMTIVDVDAQIAVDSTAFESKGRNTPFDGMKLKGKVLRTIYRGVDIYDCEGEENVH